jgi:capsular exopolysaccharide synthesis family protein
MHNEATGGNPSEIVVLPSMIPSTTESIKPWEALDKERHRIEREIAEKLKVFKSGHPQVVALNKQLNNVNKSLDSELDEALSHFNIEYANLLEKKTQLEAKLPEYRDISERHEKLVAQYKKFDSSQLKWDSFYDKESQKLDAIGYAMDKDRTTYDFVGHIELKNTPVTPQRLKTVAYSIIIGIALAIGIPFLLEYLNARVSDLEHAEETLQIRGLGVVPKISDVPIEKLLSDDGEKRYHDYHLRENFRLIRTNLVMNSENGALPQVIIVTSAMPQEGKTSVAANLAISFAAKGEKTLLIDGDLRRGRMHRLFGIPSKPGLSNFLNSEVSLDQISLSNGHSNLTLMPCGKRLNSASELLDNPAFSKLMQELRGKYQRIILDTPPVLGLSETIIMQREADGVLMVIWSDFTPMSSVKSAVQTLQVNGAKFSGFVLNRLDFSTLGNRYKYFYYAPLYYSNYQPLPAPAGNVDI